MSRPTHREPPASSDRRVPAHVVLQERSHRFSPRVVAFWGVAALGTFAWLWQFREALVDDVFITLLYSRNLVEHGVWGPWPDRLGHTATSPWNVLLLAAIGAVVRDWIAATVLAGTLGWLACSAYLVRLVRRVNGAPWVGAVACAGLLVNPMMVSTLGMEAIFQGAALLAALDGWLTRRWLPVAVAGGVGILVRPEGALVLLVLAATFAGPWRTRLRILVWGSLVAVPWFLFAWRVLGTALPETLLIKTGQQPWGPWLFHNGLVLYRIRYPLETVASLLPWLGLVSLPFSRAARRTAWPLLGCVGLHFVGYSLLRTPPQHWYFAIELVAGVAFFGLALAVMSTAGRDFARYAAMGLAVVWIGVSLAAFVPVARPPGPIAEMPIHTNRAPMATYRDIGLWLGERSFGPTYSGGEVGTLAFYCRCPLIDPFTHRGALFRHIRQRVLAGGAGAWLYRLNFAHLGWPPPEPILQGGFARAPSRNHALRPGEKRFVLRSRWTPDSVALIWIPHRSPG